MIIYSETQPAFKHDPQAAGWLFIELRPVPYIPAWPHIPVGENVVASEWCRVHECGDGKEILRFDEDIV